MKIMGFFGPFVYENKKKKKYYLHEYTGTGEKRIFYFSKDSKDAIDLPPGYEIIENLKTGLPTLKKRGK